MLQEVFSLLAWSPVSSHRYYFVIFKGKCLGHNVKQRSCVVGRGLWWSNYFLRSCFCVVAPFATSAQNDFEDADSDVHCHLLLFCQSPPHSQRLTIWPPLYWATKYPPAISCSLKASTLITSFGPADTVLFKSYLGFLKSQSWFKLIQSVHNTSPGSPHMDRELCWACHLEADTKGLSLRHQTRKVVCYPGSSSISYELSEHSSPQNWKYVQILGIQISYIPPTCWYQTFCCNI